MDCRTTTTPEKEEEEEEEPMWVRTHITDITWPASISL
jgi:hypothetical protein